jgi:pyruvate formate lyase activating enzyme
VIYTLVYADAIAAHVDPIEKKPIYNFLPGTQSFSIATVGCNFRCRFCQNSDISQAPREDAQLRGEEFPPAQVVAAALRYSCDSISYTYTEPTIFFEYAYDTAKLAHDEGLKNIFVTNGYMTLEALEEIDGYLDAANVDLKSFDDGFYRRQCGARLQPVLETIQAMHERGVWVELTTLLIPGQRQRRRTQTARCLHRCLGSGHAMARVSLHTSIQATGQTSYLGGYHTQGCRDRARGRVEVRLRGERSR